MIMRTNTPRTTLQLSLPCPAGCRHFTTIINNITTINHRAASEVPLPAPHTRTTTTQCVSFPQNRAVTLLTLAQPAAESIRDVPGKMDPGNEQTKSFFLVFVFSKQEAQ